MDGAASTTDGPGGWSPRSLRGRAGSSRPLRSSWMSSSPCPHGAIPLGVSWSPLLIRALVRLDWGHPNPLVVQSQAETWWGHLQPLTDGATAPPWLPHTQCLPGSSSALTAFLAVCRVLFVTRQCIYCVSPTALQGEGDEDRVESLRPCCTQPGTASMGVRDTVEWTGECMQRLLEEGATVTGPTADFLGLLGHVTLGRWQPGWWLLPLPLTQCQQGRL